MLHLFGMLLLLLSAGCYHSETAAQDRNNEPKKKRDEFASDQAPAEPAKMIAFDGDRAMQYLRDLCKIGPRISGSDGMRKQQEFLKEHFEKCGGKVEWQKFTTKQLSQPQSVEMTNMIVHWHPERERRVIFCSHYDTRPHADEEPDRRKWSEPFLSANDGTSGSAWMMELANHMKDLPLNVGVDLVLFDGEEYIFEKGRDKFFFGSEYFAAEYQKQKNRPKYLAAVLLDLFAGKNAKYPKEQNSQFWAGALVEDIWKTAAELKVKSFRDERGIVLDDDHIALNKVGIPAIDIVDFDYRYWHRLNDLPDECSAESFARVGKVLSVWVQRVK
jgi:hypothetical protein